MQDQSQSELRRRQKGKAVPNHYIVVLRDSVESQDVQSVAAELAGRHQGTLLHTYWSAIKGFAVRMPESAALALGQDPRVEYVEEDGVVSARNLPCSSSPTPVTSPQSPAPAHLDRIDQRNLPLDNTYHFKNRGGGVNVYVLDSGVYTAHQEFLDAQGRPRAFVALKAGGQIFDAADDAAIANGQDLNGHGTYVASLIGGRTVGVAKDVTLYSVRVLNSSASGKFSNFLAGVDYVYRRNVKPAVVNMSLGELVTDDPTKASSLETAVQNLINSGVTCVVAAPDRDADASTESPGRLADCITVGASDATTDARAGGFGYGPGVDLYAPGGGPVCVAIPVFSPGFPNNQVILRSGGTSTSAPLVTGVVAMYLHQFPSASPADVANAIKSNATQGVLKNIPAGTKNRLLYSNFF